MRNDYEGVSILEATKYPLVSGPRESSFSVTYQLPSYVYLKHVNRYNMKVATLDANGKWVDTFISETPIFDHLKKGEKSLRFNVSKQGPIAYVQPRCFDFPYKSFELRSKNEQEVLLTLVGQRETFDFRIVSGHVYLLNNTEPELAPFVSEGYEPMRFLQELARVGVLMTPVSEDAVTAAIASKDFRAQEKAVLDIAYLVGSFYIRACPFNHKLGFERTFAKVRENPDNDPVFYEDQEKDWLTLGWWENKCACFHVEWREDELHSEQRSKTHLSAFLLLEEEELCDPKLVKRSLGTEPGLYNTVAKLLLHLQLLSFTVHDYISKQEMI